MILGCLVCCASFIAPINGFSKMKIDVKRKNTPKINVKIPVMLSSKWGDNNKESPFTLIYHFDFQD